MAKPDIEILVGIEGGGSISGQSGQKIRNQLQNIISQINGQRATQVKLGIDQNHISNQITKAIHKSKEKFKIHVNQTALQNQIRNAVQSMSPVDLKVNIKPQNNGGGSGGGNQNNGLGDISQLTKEINRRELKIVGNENKTEVQALENQVTRLSKSRDDAISKYQQTHNITTKDILDTVNAERQVENILDSISAKTAKAQDTSAFAIDKLKVKVAEYINQVEKTAKRSPKLYEDLLKFQNELERGSWAGKPREANQAFLQLQATIKQAGLEQESFGQKVGRIFKEKLGYGILAAAALKARQALREIYTNVVDIDTAMTELKKVTNETDQAYKKFLDNASSRAKTLGATLSDTITATADFARLGYSMDEAAKLADSALVYKNVGDGISSITDASESVISTMKAFNIEADKSMTIVDKFNEVGNNFAISSKGVGDALLNSASALAAANNNLDESIALITAANSVVQSPEKVGTALKTVSMYLRAAKAEAEDAGESTDGMAESVSKLQKELLMLTGGKVNIMVDPQNFKSTYDILKELSKVWSQLSDVNQAAIIEKIGGKRQANVVSAILNNFTIAEETLATAHQSAGSAMKENEKYLDSINGKLSLLKASYQQFSINALDSGVIKTIVDGMTSIVNVFNSIDEATNGVSTNIFLIVASIATLITVLEVLSLKLISTFEINMITPFAALKKMIDGLSVSFSIFQLQVKNAGFGTAFVELIKGFGQTGILVAGVTAFIAAMIALDRYVKKTYPSLQQLSDTYEDNKKELDSLNSEYETTADRIIELQKLADNGTITITEEAELRRLKEQNSLLYKQIKLKEQLVSEDKGKMSDAAIAAIYGGSSDVRGMATTDENGQRIEGMKRLEVFEQDIDLYKKAKQEYADAVSSNDQQAIDTAQQTMTYLENSLRSQMNSLLEDATKVDSTTERGRKAIQTVDHAYDSYLLTIGDAKSAQEAFNNIIQRTEHEGAVSAIKELGDAGELTTGALRNLYEENQDVQELLDYLASEGLISIDDLTSVVNQFNVAVGNTSSSMMTLSDAIQKLDGPLKVLQKAFKETNEDGYISIDTLEELSSKYPGLQKYLTKTAEGYKLTKSALDEYLKSQRKEYEVALNDAKSAAIKVYENETGKTYAYARTTEAIKEQLRAIIKLNNVTIASERAAALNKYGNDAIGRQLAAKNKSNEMKVAEAAVSAASQALADLDVAQNDIDLYNRLIATAQRDANNSVKSSGTDKYKQAIEKDIKILQHKREMDLITDREYYDGLKEIQKRYLVDEEKYKEEIWDLEQEIFNGMRDLRTDWFSDMEKQAETYSLLGDANSQRAVYEEMLNEAKTAIDEAYAYGLDENSDYVQELRDQYRKTCQDILNMVQDSYDDFMSYADDFNMWGSFDFTKLEYLEKYLKEIQSLYEAGIIGWTDYVKAYNKVAKEIYDTKIDSIKTIIDLTMDMIKQEKQDEIDALDEQIEKIGKIIDLRKKMLQKQNSENNHDRQVADAVAEIAQIQSKIAQLSLDDSREAAAKRAALEEELAKKQRDLADLQGDYALDKTLDVLDETKEAKEDEVEAEKKIIEKSVDSWVKVYKLAIERIDGDWENLYDDLSDWMEEHRDSIDGPDSLKTAWATVNQIVLELGKNIGSLSIEDIYKQAGSIGLNPSTPNNTTTPSTSDASNTTSSGNTQVVSDTPTISNPAYQATVERYGDPPSGILQFGSTGKGVEWLQYYLKKLGYFKYGVDGNFYQRTRDALKEFQSMAKLSPDGIYGPKTRNALKYYHTGGIVDGTGAINDTEVMAILKKGELVLNDGQKKNLQSLMQSLVSAATMVTKIPNLFAQKRYDDVKQSMTFAPQLSVSISHNGNMTDNDAEKYGKKIGDIALETMYQTMRVRGIKG